MKMKRFFNKITSRGFAIGVILLLQIVFIVSAISVLASSFIYLHYTLIILSIIISISIVGKDTNPMYKIAYIILILAFPLFGGFFYLLFDKRTASLTLKREIINKYPLDSSLVPQNIQHNLELKSLSTSAFKTSQYISNTCSFPLYKSTYTQILTPGEVKFERLVEELLKAEKFIFVEYFIIEPGKMWDKILLILKEKARSGVDVRLIYDDIGTIDLLPRKYPKILKEFGIKTYAFNVLTPSLDMFLNCRDHRKIVVIDGEVAFTGGINIADEYINHKVIHGHWKDLSIIIKGDAVWSFTTMFLQIWFYLSKQPQNYQEFLPPASSYSDQHIGFVQPFSDSPIDSELISEFSYMNIINNAKRYVYITTPYLILDNEMISCLCLASKSGIDIKIITPYIPDKGYVHETTRSNYPKLIKAGISIFEYEPGFVHSKYIVADDDIAITGTANFDFRSFYLHFECGILMYKTAAVSELVCDFDDTLKKCKSVTLEECENIPWHRKLFRSILRVFSPVM